MVVREAGEALDRLLQVASDRRDRGGGDHRDRGVDDVLARDALVHPLGVAGLRDRVAERLEHRRGGLPLLDGRARELRRDEAHRLRRGEDRVRGAVRRKAEHVERSDERDLRTEHRRDERVVGDPAVGARTDRAQRTDVESAATRRLDRHAITPFPQNSLESLPTGSRAA